MKVLTIKQPWATLIAEGLKQYEFRTRNTKYRGDILIHAGKSIDKKAIERFKDYPIEIALLNTGKATFVASKDQREEIRSERMDQADFSDPATVKKFGKELGADYMLKGQINTITDAAGKTTLKYYQTELELIDIETNEKVWIGQKKIKKVAINYYNLLQLIVVNIFYYSYYLFIKKQWHH